MAKCYAIKIKDNCYWLGWFYGRNKYGDLAHAKIHVSKRQADSNCADIINLYGHNAKVVECTICEGDIEEELKVYKKALEKLAYYIEYDYPKKQDDIWYRKAKELEMYFINQAREEIERGKKDE